MIVILYFQITCSSFGVSQLSRGRDGGDNQNMCDNPSMLFFYVILQIALVNFMLSQQPKPNNREFKLIVNFTTCDYE